MPGRLELKEGMAVEVMGVPVVVVRARARRVVLAIGGFDADGPLESTADVKRAAARWRDKLDADAPIGDD